MRKASNFERSFLWICVSTAFYAASIITIRFAAMEALPERPKSLAIAARRVLSGAIGRVEVLSSGLLGFLLLRLTLCNGMLTLEMEVLLCSLLNAVASMSGLPPVEMQEVYMDMAMKSTRLWFPFL